ncbi:ribonuclease P/MRP protein subunit POP1 [Aspergillus brunneoviolaceus CBS 621.78]|uniref:POPLD-domain-containing protein n=1 Tax=Aspergillus brunneoviolaceus CBS 621.78 TaxID=1450534 RepID=A0ACD1G0C5_9EURO|nr:POPLD-domain-containing protein [Aspergillus brunneoviolaceus CBS 621.78]RAH42684.1 POPLD-domain-containing protein [Aspergillus brunneoviolaceus CBS 621.78]
MALNPPSKRTAAAAAAAGSRNNNSTITSSRNGNNNTTNNNSKSNNGFSAAAARKRAKTFDARTLAVQTSDAALSVTGELDVAAYVEAREFEIRSLEAGMQRSRAALTSRAFQKVPRALRRRTASHNVKRVPRRLRARARREMLEDNTPTVNSRTRKPTEQMRIRLETARRLQGLNQRTKAKRVQRRAQRAAELKQQLEAAAANTGGAAATHAFEIAPRVPKIKKNRLSRPAPPEARFRKRQRCKTWLPTHMFHAKRAKMTTSLDPLWRFAVPLSPTEKSYRPTHRARGTRGCVAWDLSYMATLQLEGAGAAVEAVLRGLGVDGDAGQGAWGVKGKKWREGKRGLRAWVFEAAAPPGEGESRRPIAEVMLVWCAAGAAGGEDRDVEMLDVDAAAAAGKQKKQLQQQRKKLWIRVHPSAFLQLWNEVLVISKQQNPPVMVEDLRFEIGSIEITGPGSMEALIASLKPVVADGKPFTQNSPEATWSSLLGVSNAASLPREALLAFSVSDPRLSHPPKTLKPPTSESDMQDLAVLLSDWHPDRTQTAPALFDRRARLAAARQMPSQKAINRRRSAAGPGEIPPAKETDPQIPVIVLACRSPAQSKDNNAPGSWTILLPWKCVLPVWYSLMYYPLSSGGIPRFGGLKEQQQLAFESGEPWFPGDYPGTRAGWEWGLREREEARKAWERRPKGRRVEFDSLDLRNGQKGEIGRGWACDWERLVHGPAKAAEDAQKTDKEADITRRDAAAAAADATTSLPPLNIHQLSSSQASRALSDRSVSVDNATLATVRISLVSRGTPTPRARIYRLPTNDPDLRQRWVSLASKETDQSKQSRANTTATDKPPSKEDAQQRLAASLIAPCADTVDDRQTHLPLPSEDDLIGFVTTGNYNLAEGKGTGIGSIQIIKVRKATTSKDKAKAKKNLCIVRSAGELVGRLGYWELV